jgi:hypothetical protein
MAVGQLAWPGPGSGSGSEQTEQEAHREVDLAHLLRGQPPDPVPEPKRAINDSHLVDQHRGRRAAGLSGTLSADAISAAGR